MRRPPCKDSRLADPTSSLTEHEQQQVEEHAPPAAKVVHAAVTKLGDEELNRPVGSLWWSAIAAGVSMMTSVWVGGALHHAMPAAPWREAVVALGYPVGFLIVVLGRMQLFTEQTVVAILPFARAKTWYNFKRVARLWAVVFLGNMTGTAAVAALAIYGQVQPKEVLEGMLAISGKLQEASPLRTALQAIPAGFIMAAVAWMNSAEERIGFPVVLVLTLAIALGGFAHVVAGAAEAWLLLWSGQASLDWVIGGFILPALAGNVIGGTGLFAVLAHAQVKDEI
jgi:formate/nitrite transporter FocA (FNT family)